MTSDEDVRYVDTLTGQEEDIDDLTQLSDIASI